MQWALFSKCVQTYYFSYVSYLAGLATTPTQRWLLENISPFPDLVDSARAGERHPAGGATYDVDLKFLVYSLVGTCWGSCHSPTLLFAVWHPETNTLFVSLRLVSALNFVQVVLSHPFLCRLCPTSVFYFVFCYMLALRLWALYFCTRWFKSHGCIHSLLYLVLLFSF